MIVYIAYDNLDEKLGTYFEECANYCRDYFEEYIQIEPVLISGHQLNQVNIDIRLLERGHEYFIFAAYSHGLEDSLISNNVPYLQSKENTHLFSGGLIYTNACLAAQELGPNLIENGAYAFVGYKDTINVLQHNEQVKKICQTADNYALILFLKGLPIGQAVEKARRFLTNKILNFNAHRISPFDVAQLIEIRDAMEIIGNRELVIGDLME